MMLKKMQPLIERSIIGFLPTDIPQCECCASKFEAHMQDHRDKLDRISRRIFRKVAVKLTFEVMDNEDGTTSIELSGPDSFVPEGTIVLTELSPGALREVVDRGTGPTKEELREMVEAHMLTPIVNDLMLQDYARRSYGKPYLTDRGLDTEYLDRLRGKDAPQTCPTDLPTALLHSLPIVAEVPIEKLLELRQKEGEAFELYRSSMRKFLKSAAKLTSDELSEAYFDTIKPEIDQISVTIRQVKKMVKRSLREKVVIGTGTVAIGIASGQLSPELGAVVAAVGGGHLGGQVLAGLDRLHQEPAEIMDNPYYFLWKASKEVAPKHCHRG